MLDFISLLKGSPQLDALIEQFPRQENVVKVTVQPVERIQVNWTCEKWASG